MLVQHRMTLPLYTVTPTTTLAEAFALSRANRIRHLPVLEDGKLVGVITERDLRLAGLAEQHDELQSVLESKTIRDVMVTEIVTTTPDTPIELAAKLLYEHRIGCLPVMNGDELVGMLTERDVMRAFVEMFGTTDPSTRIEILIPNRAGELARVVRLIGIDHKLNITGLVVPPLAGTGEALAIVHLQTVNANAVVEQFRKLGYRVGSPSISLEPETPAVREPRRSFADAL